MTYLFNDYDPEELKRLLKWIAVLLVACVGCAILSSCRTIVPQERIIYHTDTLRQVQRDSIFYHFTDTIREKTKGDTIYIENIKWRTAYREFLRCDTIIRTDSVSTTNNVIVAQMNGFQRTFFWLGWAFVALVVLWVAWKVVKIYLHKF